MQRSKVPEDFLSLAGACWQERTFPMQKFYRLSVNIVKILTLLLAVFLFIGSFLTTCYAENMETQQVLLRFDNPLWNLLELAGYGLLFACCLSLSGKAGAKFRRGLLVFTLGLILLLGGMLIVFGRTVPAADALSVYNAAAEWILGNKDIIHPTFSYLSYYPQQIGLMAMAVCLTITSVGVLPLVQKCYEKKAGNTLSSGVTAMSYFAMGMQESSRGCGWYNGFNIDTYDAAGMNSDAANTISRAAINERIAYFREHPGYAVNFYLHKHLSQWADGTYASRQATLATYGGRSDFLKEVYEGSLASAYIEWGNAWQNVLYLGMLLFCIATVRKRRPGNGSANAAANDDFRFRNLCLYTYTGLIAVLGGFLFHTIWEANSRYIFVYSLLLMPYCAAGVHDGLVRLAAWRSNRTLTRHSNS